jgi:hypothetical protein
MSGLGSVVLGAAPLAGGLLFGAAAAGGRSSPSASDLRTLIKSDLEILKQIPEDEVIRRAGMKRVVSYHLAALVAASERSGQVREWTGYWTTEGHWRDIVLVIAAVLFALVAWFGLDHDRPWWLLLFLGSIVLAVMVAVFAVRAFLLTVHGPARRDEDDQRDRHS